MRTIKMISTFVALLLLASIQTGYAQMSIDGELDIADLMATAKSEFDLSNEDAVLLYDSEEITWQQDRRLKNSIHRIIWIGTDNGIYEFGDHRVPYDHANRTLTVETIRTWRDNQWWVTGETGVVETLPYALDDAYDYTNMREMMLLHDGIELPCILEVAYTIEDKELYRKGAEGIWLCMREVPSVSSKFVVSFPEGYSYIYSAPPIVPGTKVETRDGMKMYVWTTGPTGAGPRPHTNDPSAYVPRVLWSTWRTWGDYGNDILTTFEAAMEIDDPLKQCLDSILDESRTDYEKARLIADFVSTATRFVNYPEIYWQWLPRPAKRTYSTSYAHGLDRAVLAATLFREAGLEAAPMYVGRGYGMTHSEVPIHGRMNGVGVHVSSDNFAGYYDPAVGNVISLPSGVFNRVGWILGKEYDPNLFLNREDLISSFGLSLDMEFDSEHDLFSGEGALIADGSFNAFTSMRGLSNESKSYLSSLMSSVIEDAEVTDFSISRFDDSGTVVGFAFELKKPDFDDYDRVQMRFLTPESGVAGKLPDDVELFDQERQSPIHLPSTMVQTVEIRLKMDSLEVVYLPNDQSITNQAGSFALTTSSENERVIMKRELNLTKELYEPGEWPALRELLLAEQHEKNQMILLKPSDSEGNEDEL